MPNVINKKHILHFENQIEMDNYKDNKFKIINTNGPNLNICASVLIYLSKKDINIVLKAITPEKNDRHKSRIDIKKCSEGIKLIVYTTEANALRATLNSYLRWIQVALNVCRLNEQIK